jgi:hypothetical protein
LPYRKTRALNKPSFVNILGITDFPVRFLTHQNGKKKPRTFERMEMELPGGVSFTGKYPWDLASNEKIDWSYRCTLKLECSPKIDGDSSVIFIPNAESFSQALTKSSLRSDFRTQEPD